MQRSRQRSLLLEAFGPLLVWNHQVMGASAILDFAQLCACFSFYAGQALFSFDGERLVLQRDGRDLSVAELFRERGERPGLDGIPMGGGCSQDAGLGGSFDFFDFFEGARAACLRKRLWRWKEPFDHLSRVSSRGDRVKVRQGKRASLA